MTTLRFTQNDVVVEKSTGETENSMKKVNKFIVTDLPTTEDPHYYLQPIENYVPGGDKVPTTLNAIKEYEKYNPMKYMFNEVRDAALG